MLEIEAMDAPHDRDIELQRVSSDFIEELKVKLPPLLWKPTQGKSSIVTRQPRRWAQSAKTDKLISLVRKNRFLCISPQMKEANN